jgi:putative copper export protein/methionine-rich copper-binding protein CopC
MKFLAVAAMIAATAFPSRLLAHTHLRSSSPASGAVVTAPLAELRFTFNETPEPGFTSVELTGPDGKLIALGLPVLSGSKTLVVPVSGIASGGNYRVKWKTAGKDGHPAAGEFGFSVVGIARVSAPVVPPTPADTMKHHDSKVFPESEEFSAESPAYVAIRLLQFAALLMLVGAIAFRYTVLRALRNSGSHASLIGPAEARTALMARWSAGALFVLAIIRLAAQSYAMHGANQTMLGAMRPMVLHTVWGSGWLIQFVASFLAGTALLLFARLGNRGWNIAAVGTLALAFTPALSGHAASAPRFASAAVAADAVHILGAGGWLGSLLMVLIAGIPAALKLGEESRSVAVADIVNSFSPVALVSAAMLSLTGVFAAWMHMNSLSALWASRYGQTLLIKLAVLSVVAGTGAYNWLRVRPALGDARGTARVRRSATVEIIVGVLVLVVTAILVATPTPMDV